MKKGVLILLLGVVFLIGSVSAVQYANCAAVPVAIRDQGGITRACEEVSACGNIANGNTYYLLTQDMESDQSCLQFVNSGEHNKVIDLNEHTITFGNVVGTNQAGISMSGVSSTNVTIMNGIINQGVGNGTDPYLIRHNPYELEWGGILRNVNVNNIEGSYYGQDGRGIFIFSTTSYGTLNISNNRIYPNVTLIVNRMRVHSGIQVGVRSDDVYNVYGNVVEGKGHGGISAGRHRLVDTMNNPILIYNNTVKIWGVAPNPIAITGGNNAEIFDNFINQTNARGIYFAGDGNSALEGDHHVSIHDNYIEVRENAHPEYPSGDPIGGPVGIRIRYGSHDGIIYNNTIFAHTEPGFGNAVGIRISVGGAYSENITIRDNTITALTTDPDRQAIALMVEGDDGDYENAKDTHIINNRLISNDVPLALGGGNGAPKDVVLISNTLVKREPVTSSFVSILGAYCGPCDSMNNSLIDTNLENGAAMDDIIFGGTGLRDVMIKWFLDVHVQASGSPANLATVRIYNSTDDEIFVGSTDETGYIPQQTLKEFAFIGSNLNPPRYDYIPYTINVTYGGETQSREVYLNESLTESFDFYSSGNNPDVNSDGNVDVIDLAIAIFNQDYALPDDDYDHLDINQDGSLNWADVLMILLGI